MGRTFKDSFSKKLLKEELSKEEYDLIKEKTRSDFKNKRKIIKNEDKD